MELFDKGTNQPRLRVQSHLSLRTITGVQLSSNLSGWEEVCVCFFTPLSRRLVSRRTTYFCDSECCLQTKGTFTCKSAAVISDKKSQLNQKFHPEKELFFHRNMLKTVVSQASS